MRLKIDRESGTDWAYSWKIGRIFWQNLPRDSFGFIRLKAVNCDAKALLSIPSQGWCPNPEIYLSRAKIY